jgi:hypothetical protein
LMKKRNERTSLRMSSLRGPRSPRRMSRMKRWVSHVSGRCMCVTLTINRGLQDVEAGLRRSYGKLQGRGGFVIRLANYVSLVESWQIRP